MKYIVHFGFNNQHESDLIRRYAEREGCHYQWEGLKNDLFQTASVLKYASMVVIWNGLQYGASLATRLCRRRGIPLCYLEWGLLPQTETFMIDPLGFCGDSILARDVSWVTEADMERLRQVRAALQQRYPLQRQDHVLTVLQIENDSQTLYFSPYRTMDEFVADVEAMFPAGNIIARPHPKSTAKRTFARAQIKGGGDFLAEACQAGVVVGVTSTCLYEAAILGVPVVAMGDHPLRVQPKHLHERVLAGALALRVNRADGDLGAVLDRFGIRPLSGELNPISARS